MKTSRLLLLPAVVLAGLMMTLMCSSNMGPAPTSSGDAAAVAMGSPPAAPPAKLTAEGRTLVHQFSAAFENAAATVNRSVVPIFAEQVVTLKDPFFSHDPFGGRDFFHRFFGPNWGEMRRTVRSLGSGVIITPDGYTLTNNHVVQGAQKLKVVLSDGRSFAAHVVGTDPETDVAVIKFNGKDLPAATLGNSDGVHVGQWVIAVGNPFELLHTVTSGIISAKARSGVELADYEDFLQTDAPINPGNSGGALADLDGRVIGINTAISTPSGGSVGLGFAIPINNAKAIMDQLIAHGKVTRAYLGVLPQDIDHNLASALHLPNTKGALIGEVTTDTPAAKAGLEVGDVITAFNGKKVADSTALRQMVAQSKVGSTAVLEVLRHGKTRRVNVVLAERPGEAQPSHKTQQARSTGGRLGIQVQTLTPDVAQNLGYGAGEHGVVIVGVEPGSRADDVGLKRGDIIKAVDHTKVADARRFVQLVHQAEAKGPVALLVQRGKRTFFIAIAAQS